MSPLQKIAMGLVIVLGSATLPADPTPSWKQYDALADPLGWVLVIAGVFALARVQDSVEGLRWGALLAGAVSVPMWFPQLHHRLDASGQWFASLPQLVFCLLLARAIGILGAQQQPPDAYVAKRFGLLVWGFALAAVLPVLALGGGLEALENPAVLVSLVAGLALVYLLFRVHRRPWLGGPGPLEVGPRRGAGPGTQQGRPPSR